MFQLAGLDLQDGQSQKSSASVGRYIPPHLRNKPQSSVGEDNQNSDRDSSSGNRDYRRDNRGGSSSGYRGKSSQKAKKFCLLLEAFILKIQAFFFFFYLNYCKDLFTVTF